MACGDDIPYALTENDLDLLACYTRDQSEDAFAEIVRRQADLVYSEAVKLAYPASHGPFSPLAKGD